MKDNISQKQTHLHEQLFKVPTSFDEKRYPMHEASGILLLKRDKTIFFESVCRDIINIVFVKT